jgi:predicted O-methyltransferase YrrM
MTDHDTEKILKLARDFMESRILLSGAELNLFTLLSREPLTARDVSARIGADLRALTILLDALAAMGLLAKEEERYRCADGIAPLLAEDAPVTILPMILHMAHLWHRWSVLTPLARGHRTLDKQPARGRDEMRAFIGAMHVIAEPQAAKIVQAVDPAAAKALIDVGGASGTYTLAFLRAVPEMKATLFDRPEVVGMARERFEKEGLLHRVTLVPGDFHMDELPPGHDLAFVSAIIHQNSLGENAELYAKVFRSLKKGGRIVIRDHVMDPGRTRPRSGAVFAVNMLMGTSGGGTYTFAEIEAGLSQTGFTRIRLIRSGEHMDALVEAFKP